MSEPTLYHYVGSGNSLAVLWTAHYLNLDLKVKIINLSAKEQYHDEFLKINPRHCVPTLQDGDLILNESRAIAAYLINSRFPNHAIYPNDPKLRAVIDQRLYFDISVLNQRVRDIFLPVLYENVTKIDDGPRKKLFEAIEWLDGFLNGQTYVAGGDSVSIADFFISTTVARLMCIGADFSGYKNIVRWHEKLSTLRGFEINMEGAKQFAAAVNRTLKDKL